MELYSVTTIECPLCNGRGAFPLRAYARMCSECAGTGRNLAAEPTLTRPSLSVRRSGLLPVPCAHCQGTGQIPTTDYERCAMCHATGRIPVYV